jgi:GWxTD domain-containing protein
MLRIALSGHVPRTLAFLGGLALLPATHLLAGPGLDKADERWLREVHLLILPEEEATFRALGTPEDRQQFQRVFWARRDPDPATPRNEMQDAIAQGRKRADDLFTSVRERGSETGCGQVFLLLGEPPEVEGRELQQQFNSLRPMREGARPPERWTYRSRPGDPVEFTAGELRIPFDEECRFSEGGRILEDLRRVARSRIVRPALDYRTTAEGRLIRLEELEPGRTDFPLALEPKLLLRTQDGLGYVAGLFRADLSGSPDAAPGATVEGVVVTEGVSPSGPLAARTQRAFSASFDATGLVGSYGVALAAGTYTLRVGVRLKNGKSSSASLPLEVPDFAASGFLTTPLILYPDEPEAPSGPKDAFAALTIGSLRLRPRLGEVFKTSDSLQVVALLFGGAKDPATNVSALRASFTILKDGKAIAKGQDQVFETPTAVASVGPIPLADFAPGRYLVRFEGKDEKAGTRSLQEKPFEIRE